MKPQRFASDPAILADLHATSFEPGWSAEAFAELLAAQGNFAFMIEGQGFVLARAAADEAEILTLAVAPAARRQGVALALVVEAARQARRLGADTMFLEVALSNNAARALYDRLGFRRAGRRKAYYTSPGGHMEDALVLRGDLPLPPLGKSGQLD